MQFLLILTYLFLFLLLHLQVRHLVDTGEEAGLNTHCDDIIVLPSPRFLRQGEFILSYALLQVL